MSSLPKQRVTFFFSDIERSTQLIAELGERYARVLQEYHSTMRALASEYNGREMDTAGDGFFIVFPEVQDALQVAIRAQRAFAVQAWARRIGFRVRIGLHTGDAVVSPSGYIGLEVHRGARVCNAAHGGQVLLSESTCRLVKDRLPANVTLRDLGEFLLRGFKEPERLYQLVIMGLPDKFPEPRSEKPVPTVAVLPFTNQSGDPQRDFLGRGIAEEIIIALGKIPGLQVVARASAFAIADQGLDMRDIGERLNANVVLEGSIRVINNRLRVNASLVSADTGYNLWSGSFDRNMEDIFAVQDEIAENIATTLKIKLISSRVRPIQTIQTADLRAYQRYLRGRQYYYQFSPERIEQAMALFREAIDFDPEYALAYCGLANCYAYRYLYVDNLEANLLAAGSASRQAIDLDPLLAEAYVAYGQALSLEHRYEEAEAAFEKALELDHRLFEARYLFGRLFFAQGKLEEAAYWFEEANRSRPDDFQSLLLAGQVYDDLGRADKATAARRRGIEVAEHSLLLNPGNVRARYLGANGLVALGEKAKGLDWIRSAIKLAPHDPMVLYNAGCVFALLDMPEEALGNLEAALREGITQLAWYENDSNLDRLRGLPRFQQLLDRLAQKRVQPK